MLPAGPVMPAPVTRPVTVVLATGLAVALSALAASPAAAEEVPAPAGRPAMETVVRARAAAPSAPAEDKAAAASVVIPDESPRAYDDLGGLLLEVPGVTVTRTGSLGAFASLTLRGASPDEVRVYLDGVPLNLAAGGAVDVSTLPLGDVERVEIYRGTTPLVFGESALGGVVSITTRTPGPASAKARAGLGSFGSAFGDLSAGRRVGRLRFYLGAHAFSAQGDYPYLNDNMTALNPSDDVYGPRKNNDVLQGDGVLRVALTLGGRRTLTLGLIAFARDQGLTSTGGNPTAQSRFTTTRGLATLRYESRDDLGPGGKLSAQLWASDQRDRLSDLVNELGAGGAALRRDTTRSAGASAYASRPFGDWLRAAAVLEGRGESYGSIDELAAVPEASPARRLVGAAGAELDLRVRRLDLDVIPSVRAEVMSDRLSRRDGGGDPAAEEPAVTRLYPVWRLGLVRPLGAGAVLKANLGRYVRAPSFIELYGNGTGRLLGNTGLLPERGTNGDLALWLDHKGERVAIASRTTLFGALADDLIQWQYSSWGQGRAGNIGRARIWGAEQELRLAPGSHFRLVAQATALVAVDASEDDAARGKQIPFHPRYHAYLRPEVVRIALPAAIELAAYVDGDLRAASWSDPANKQSNRTRVMLGAGLTVGRPRSGIRVTASAANLTDARELDVTAWTLPGRSVFLSLSYAPVAGDEPAAKLFDPRHGS